MRPFLRFVFSDAHQASVDPGNLQVDDVPYAGAPAEGAPYPQSLRLSFNVVGPTPQVMPLFPGQMTFIADPAAPGVVPSVAEVDPANYPAWRTRGNIVVKLVSRALMEEFLTPLMEPVGVIPTTLWYGPVTITSSFLFTTLTTGLAKRKLVAGGATIRPTAPLWSKHAVVAFLKGQYSPELRLGATEASDDVVMFPMPEVVVAPDGSATLTISVARTQKPQDANDAKFDLFSGAVPRSDPAHWSHGAIPARHAYRALRLQLIGAATGRPVPDAVLADWPAAPRYFLMRFTRTWRPEVTFSAYLPQAAVTVREQGGGVIAAQRLPAHGVFYLSQQPATPPPPAPRVDVRLFGGELRWLDGATPDIWRVKGATTSLPYDLSGAAPHIVVRRAMSDEMLADETDQEVKYNVCTYLSMRRTLRALIDNRISGGRLVAEGTKTRELTFRLIDDAFSPVLAALASPVPLSSPAVVFRDGMPPMALKSATYPAGPATTTPKFLSTWMGFFPDPAPVQTVNGSTERTEIYLKGQVAYYLWQSGKEMAEEGTKRNFPDAVIGRGAAGALVYTGLAAQFFLDPLQFVGEPDLDYFDRIVDAMTDPGPRPGTLLQFWAELQGFMKLKARLVFSGADMIGFGHSPIYVNGDLAGIYILDQQGTVPNPNFCPTLVNAGRRQLEWLVPIEIWCAAEWDE